MFSTPARKAVAVTVLHLMIVTSLGAKLLYDRKTRPRVWVQVVSYDPNLPIRGRYASLNLLAEPEQALKDRIAQDIQKQLEERKKQTNLAYVGPVNGTYNDVRLELRDGKLIAVIVPEKDYRSLDSQEYVFWRQRPTGEIELFANKPVIFFLPEHADDPTNRRAGEELWAEVTIPKKGPPRPIRLGVKKDGVITPLSLD